MQDERDLGSVSTRGTRRRNHAVQLLARPCKVSTHAIHIREAAGGSAGISFSGLREGGGSTDEVGRFCIDPFLEDMRRMREILAVWKREVLA